MAAATKEPLMPPVNSGLVEAREQAQKIIDGLSHPKGWNDEAFQ